MNPIWNLAQLGMTAWQGVLTEKKWKEYQAAVERQIAEGKSGLQARQDVAMRMIATDPSFAKAANILQRQATELPANAYAEVGNVITDAKNRRTKFLSDYDAATGKYLSENDASTAKFLAGLEADKASGLSGYSQREKEVMGLLEGQGEQAMRDTRRTFGEQSSAALGDLASRGLAGSSVGSSVRSGFATREADQLARIREAVAAQRAGALSGLRGDTLGFGERATTLGAGFGNEAITRRLGAQTGAATGRAAYDAAMSGDTADRRAAALQTAYGLDTGATQDYAGFLVGQGQNALNTYLDTSGDVWGFLNDVQNVPPNPAPFYQSAAQTGYGFGR